MTPISEERFMEFFRYPVDTSSLTLPLTFLPERRIINYVILITTYLQG